ncbi:MAG: alpha-mannosidase [Clostridia bacterium]|nr:alpha-mannosidase [Clostridia bacterium]
MSNQIHLIGNAHLDPIWLWRWQEGCGEVLQTFRAAIDRLKEFDGFIFTCSSAAYYEWVEQIDPDLFSEIRDMIKIGRWVPVGGWWVQPDCNMPSGESFARHALYSQLYYYKKFGRICKTGYNVDSFGHCGNLPQLLSLGGMRTYVMMRPGMHENPDIPENLFWWDGVDGSRVLTYRIKDSYGHTGTEDLDRTIDALNAMLPEKQHDLMLFCGVGNHGGGPTRGDLGHLARRMEEKSEETLRFSSPDTFFETVCGELLDVPSYRGELQHHASGCYSATSLVKQLNRRAENRLAAAEAWDAVAAAVCGSAPSAAALKEAWKDVCFNQFHDILCGCSIMEAYEDVKNSIGHAVTIADRTENAAQLRIASRINTWLDGINEPVTLLRHHCHKEDFPRPVVVFNPHAFPVRYPVRTNYPSKAVTDAAGRAVPFQNVRSSRSNDSHLDTLFLADLPALGYALYWLSWLPDDEVTETCFLPASEDCASDLRAGETFLENEHIRVQFDRNTGTICSLVTKADGYDFAAGNRLAAPTVLDDHTTDTWAHGVFRFETVKGEMELESIALAEYGPARAVMRVKHRYGDSHLTQDFILTSDAKMLRVKCKAVWQEPFTMLKAAFPLNGTDTVNTYEIPGAFIKRPTNGEEEPMLGWADLTLTGTDGARHGIAVLNDGKYSCDCPDSTLRPTLLRNVIFADHYSYRPAADFNYTDEGLHRFEYAILPHAGEAESTDVAREAAVFNRRPNAVPVGYRKGDLPPVQSFLSVTEPNIVVTAFKKCEDGSGDLILRAYEAAGRNTGRVGFVCDLADAGFWADFRAHEVKTFRIGREGYVTETDFLEGIIQ